MCRPGRELDDGSLNYRIGTVNPPNENGQFAFEMRIEGSTRVAIDANQVKELVAGKSENEAREILNREFVLDPQSAIEISTWPGFLGRLPILPVRISVNVQGG